MFPLDLALFDLVLSTLKASSLNPSEIYTWPTLQDVFSDLALLLPEKCQSRLSYLPGNSQGSGCPLA